MANKRKGHVGTVGSRLDDLVWSSFVAIVVVAIASVKPIPSISKDLTAGVPDVKADTLYGKVIVGYQGWFTCDPKTAQSGWSHWFVGQALDVDLIPDVSELPAGATCATTLTARNGAPVKLYAGDNAGAVDTHFRWMRQYGLDGVAVQRFGTALRNPMVKRHIDAVLRAVGRAAEASGRVYFVMYDISGLTDDQAAVVADDWAALEREGLTRGSRYLHHRGRPLLAVWGFGVQGRKMTPSNSLSLIARLRQESAPYGGATILGGVPLEWRRLAEWRPVYAKLDVVSPWSVGGYATDAETDAHFHDSAQDLTLSRNLGADYMPVIFPGFSWTNAMATMGRSAPFDAIPRRCGDFLMRQAADAEAAGARTLFVAMFDEVNEGTAIYKTLDDPEALPEQPPLLSKAQDRCGEGDRYLRLTGEITAALRRRAATPAPVPQPSS